MILQKNTCSVQVKEKALCQYLRLVAIQRFINLYYHACSSQLDGRL